MPELTFSDSVVVERPAEELYDMIADVTRMGEWSPVCKACWWDEGESLRVGAWFTGRNVTPVHSWETRSKVVVAERGREFAFVVGGTRVRWGYVFEPVVGGTKITESWEFLPGGVEMYDERFGDNAKSEIEDRATTARQVIPETLAAIKAAAESA